MALAVNKQFDLLAKINLDASDELEEEIPTSESQVFEAFATKQYEALRVLLEESSGRSLVESLKYSLALCKSKLDKVIASHPEIDAAVADAARTFLTGLRLRLLPPDTIVALDGCGIGFGFSRNERYLDLEITPGLIHITRYARSGEVGVTSVPNEDALAQIDTIQQHLGS